MMRSSRIRKLAIFGTIAGIAIGLAVLILVVKFAIPAYHIRLAQRELANHGAAAAFEHLKQAQWYSPRSARIEFLLARAHRKLGNVKGMQDCLDRSQTLGYSVDAIRRERWMALAQAGQLAESVGPLRAHLAESSEDADEICEALVNGYLRNYDFSSAGSWLDAWEADFPNSAQPHYCRGLIWLHFFSPIEAAEAFRRVLEIDPTRSDARLELAEALARQHHFDEAIEHYRICCEQRPEDPRAMSGLAECRANRGENEQAGQLYREVLQRWPDYVPAIVGMGKQELAAGRAAEAVELLEPVLARQPHHKELRYALASALRAVGRNEEAEEHFAYVREANEALSRVQTLTEETLVHPGVAEPRYEIGTLLLKFGSPAEGIAWLESVLQVDPDHAATKKLLAEYYSGRGEPARE